MKINIWFVVALVAIFNAIVSFIVMDNIGAGLGWTVAAMASGVAGSKDTNN